MTTTAPSQDLIGLPPDTTLLDFGKWLLDPKNQRDVDAYLGWVQTQGAEVGSRILQTVDAAVELAKTSTTAGSYLRDPVGWIEKYVEFPAGKSLAPYQGEALETLARQHRLAVRGPHALGKSSLAALGILWFANTRESAGIDWKIPTTASAWRQLLHYLWPEVHVWARRLRWDLLGRPPYSPRELLNTSLSLDYGEAWAMATNDPNALEGAHARHMLYIFDEGKSIDVAIWDSAEGAFAGAGPDTDAEAWALALSVPGAPSGRFHQIHKREHGFEHWTTRHVKKEEAIAAGRISAAWVEQMKRQWGERSAIYQQRVEGNFASSETNSVIPLEWVEHAIERFHERRAEAANLGPAVGAGLDIARQGGDVTVLAVTCRDTVLPLIRPTEYKTPALVAAVKVALARYPGRPAVMVDAEGIGAGIYDGLTDGPDWQGRVWPFVAQGKANWTDYTRMLEFGNARAAAWWSLRDELNPDRADGFVPTLALPPDDLLIGDLTAPTYREGSGGRLFIEEKDEIRKRLGRSTDSGDSVCQARWAIAFGARAAITAASHRSPTSSGDLRRQPDAAGPGHGDWSPLTVSW